MWRLSLHKQAHVLGHELPCMYSSTQKILVQLTCVLCLQGNEIVIPGSTAWSIWSCSLTCIASLAQPRCSSQRGHALGRPQQPLSPLPSRQSPCSARMVPHECHVPQRGTARGVAQAGVKLKDGCIKMASRISRQLVHQCLQSQPASSKRLSEQFKGASIYIW